MYIWLVIINYCKTRHAVIRSNKKIECNKNNHFWANKSFFLLFPYGCTRRHVYQMCVFLLFTLSLGIIIIKSQKQEHIEKLAENHLIDTCW
jgi:hypothetical protein